MKTKKNLILLALAVIMVFTLTACGAALTAIAMKPTVTMVKGDTMALVLEFTFDKELEQAAYDKAVGELAVTYASSDEGVATVDEKGTVTAIDGGEAVITATVSENVQAECAVTVTVPVDSVTAPETLDLSTNVEPEASLDAEILPKNATVKAIAYASDNEEVATVDENGKVTAIGKGTATITATASGKTAETTVTVKVAPESIRLEQGTGGTIAVGGGIQLVARTNPAEADASTYTYKSDNSKVATVNAEGYVTAVATGSATITVTSAEGHTADYKATVAVKCGYCGGFGHTQSNCPVQKAAVAKQQQAAAAQAGGGSSAGGSAGSAGGASGDAPAPAPAVDVSGAISAGIGYGQSRGLSYSPGCGGSCATNLPFDSLLASNICQAIDYYISLVGDTGFSFDVVSDGSYVYVYFS